MMACASWAASASDTSAWPCNSTLVLAQAKGTVCEVPLNASDEGVKAVGLGVENHPLNPATIADHCWRQRRPGMGADLLGSYAGGIVGAM